VDAFLDLYMPEEIKGMPCRSQPRFSTKIVLAKSGDEGRNQNWRTPLRRFVLPEAVSDQESFEAALDFWLVTSGPFHSWPFRDPFDFASVALDQPNVEPEIALDDQPLGTADGLAYAFQLVKQRTVSGRTFEEDIFLPIVDTVLLGMNGYAPEDVPGGLGGPYSATISRPGGLVTFSPIPQAGLVLTAGFLFDREVRWEGDDSFDGIIHSLETTGVAEIDLVEVRRC
jgi:uncharacterized protein (TIGR02217 family)